MKREANKKSTNTVALRQGLIFVPRARQVISQTDFGAIPDTSLLCSYRVYRKSLTQEPPVKSVY